MDELLVKYGTYPRYVVSDFGTIVLKKNEGQNNEKVIFEAAFDGVIDNDVWELSFSQALG